MVSLWIEGGNYCGIAYLMSTVSQAFESSAFSVVARDCATGYFSFGHEFGHNMSAHHDWYVSSSTNPYPYIHGYVYFPDRWRTIMAYNTECSDKGSNCTRIQYWSNPDVSYNSVPMGVPAGQLQPSDNRMTLNNTAYTVANFRTAPTPDIKANGLDGPLTITTSDTLSVTIALDPGSYTGVNADYWILARISSDWFHYEVGSGWQPGLSVTHQGSLFNLAPFEILNTSGLPVNSYTLYFAVDMIMNGSIDLDQIYYDGVGVTVTP
jgi:hypothetical protein